MIIIQKKKDQNLHTFRKGLDSLIRKIEKREIIIKPASKGSIIVLCCHTTIRIYVSAIFQIHHIAEC